MKKFNYFLISIISFNLFALRLTPMAGYMTPSGNQSVFNFTAINSTNSPEALKVRIEYRNPEDQMKYGKTASELFQVYPKKAILFPKKSGKTFKRDIKLVWVGGEVKDIERSFRLIVEQVPLNFSKKKLNGGKMQIVSRYIASVYVAAPKFKSSVSVLSSKVSGGKLIVDVKNTGTKHHLFKDLSVKIKINGSVRSLTRDEMKGIYLYSVLANSNRQFVVELPRELKRSRINANNIEIQI